MANFILAWYFAVNTFYGGWSTIGPFSTVQQCNAIRNQITNSQRTDCWEYNPAASEPAPQRP